MTLWLVEPRDTLVLRDGRPMRGDGLQMSGMPVPYPSALAGFMRTRSATDESGQFTLAGDREACANLLGLSVRGPWLALVSDEAAEVQHLLPAPRDALVLQAADSDPRTVRLCRLVRIARQALGQGIQLSLDAGLDPLVPVPHVTEKRTAGVPLWHWEQVQRWLTDPESLLGERRREALGVEFPEVENRISVKLDPETMTGEDGQLFSVEHRRYQIGRVAPTQAEQGAGTLHNVRRLQLVVACDSPSIRPGVAPFAGERRMVFLRSAETTEPAVPEAVVEQIANDRRARVVLLTPGHYEAGWRPQWLVDPAAQGIALELKAAVVPRPEVVSGWDMLRGCPKPTRRLCPAGTVFFVELDCSPEAARDWARRIWWQTTSDTEQARRDGFGLCVVGADPAAKEGQR